MTPFRPHSTLLFAIPALLFAAIAFSQAQSDRPPWAQKPKSTATANSTSKPSTASTSTAAPTSAPDGGPGKIVQPTPPPTKNDSQDPASQPDRIRVNVNLVNVFVSVLDEKNCLVHDTPTAEFHPFYLHDALPISSVAPGPS